MKIIAYWSGLEERAGGGGEVGAMSLIFPSQIRIITDPVAGISKPHPKVKSGHRVKSVYAGFICLSWVLCLLHILKEKITQ
jgi:hypothetical protein